MRGVQKERPSLYDLADDFAAMTIPTLIMVGDEDEGAIEASIMLKRTIPASGLIVLPRTGHTLNLEEPAWFNASITWFLGAVSSDSWTPRDARSRHRSTTGMVDRQS
jgi:pimeloyl-ACP methyl ester carboxylesterase